VNVKLPPNTRAKDLEIVLERNFLSLKLKNSKDYIIKSELDKPIKPKDSFWTVGKSCPRKLILLKCSDLVECSPLTTISI
jgi:hypothetical protein